MGWYLTVFGALVLSTASCDLLLGIEGVEEITPGGSGGAGGASAGGSGGTGGACEPATCTSLGWQCGTGDDGCGTPLECEGCEPGYACNNNTHECVCQPDTCEALLPSCGVVMDHCGIQLECQCPTGFACSPRGQCQCVPVDPCPPYQCGQHDDGCGTLVTCGGDCTDVCGVAAPCNADGQCDCNMPM